MTDRVPTNEHQNEHSPCRKSEFSQINSDEWIFRIVVWALRAWICIPTAACRELWTISYFNMHRYGFIGVSLNRCSYVHLAKWANEKYKIGKSTIRKRDLKKKLIHILNPILKQTYAKNQIAIDLNGAHEMLNGSYFIIILTQNPIVFIFNPWKALKIENTEDIRIRAGITASENE